MNLTFLQPPPSDASPIMDAPTAALIGSLIGFVGVVVTISVQSSYQKIVAKLNAEKDLKINYTKIKNERYSKKFENQMEILQEIHIILSKVNFDYSLTGINIEGQNKIELKDHNRRYIENIRSLDKVKAIVDINYPDLSKSISDLYGQANLYWGHRWMYITNKDNGNDQQNYKFLQETFDKTYKASQGISALVNDIHREIAMSAKALREKFDKVEFEEVNTDSTSLYESRISTNTFKKLFWGLFFGSLVGVFLLAPESNFSVRLRGQFYTLKDSILSLLGFSN